MKKRKKLNLTTYFVLIVGSLMLITNILVGYATMSQSKSIMNTLLRKNMLDISNTAAGCLDGDKLGALTEADVDGPVFNEIKDALTVFKNSTDIEFIYAVKQVGNEKFVFTVDPDPVDPGAFGEEIIVTEGLIQAGKGIAAVDSSTAEDRWGNFYSSFSPVFDSSGRVAGIVGIDFSADWFNDQVSRHMLNLGVISALSILVSILVVILVTTRVRKQFIELSKGLATVSSDVEKLKQELTDTQVFYEDAETKSVQTSDSDSPAVSDSFDGDELEELSERIQSVRRELKSYLDFLHVQAYTDGLTGVGNSTAYHEYLHTLEEKIEAERPPFALVLFDIDMLKDVNDRFGHANGDRIIRAAADTLSSVFRKECIFRIGGDEFIVIEEGANLDDMNDKIRQLDSKIVAYNEKYQKNSASLGLSAGAAAFEPGHDRFFRDVFVRADKAMYNVKNEHHAKVLNIRAVGASR